MASSSSPTRMVGQMEGGGDELSPLEQEVLDEYARLAGNLGTVSYLPSSSIALPTFRSCLSSHLDDGLCSIGLLGLPISAYWDLND